MSEDGKKKFDPSHPPGKIEERVFIGGNYDIIAPLKEIYKYVQKVGFTPIFAWYFDAPKDKINEYDLRLLHECKYAIFEVTTAAGHLMELERAAKDYGNIVLLVYNVRDSDNRRPPNGISTMIKTLKRPARFGYATFDELERLICYVFANLKELRDVDEKTFRDVVEDKIRKINADFRLSRSIVLTDKENREVQNMLDAMYLLLLIDQLPNGAWGRTMSAELRKRYSPEMGRGSISCTSFAVKGILSYTNNPQHFAIKKALKFLSKHRKKNGSYGPQAPISVYEGKYTIVENCRHTAAATLTLMKLYGKITPETIKSIRFLLNHQKSDGGWGISSDMKIEDSDCLTTAQVLNMLFLSVKMGLERYINPSKIHAGILKGIGWICETQENGFWTYGSKKEYKTQYTSFLLQMVPELERYAPLVYERALSQLTIIYKDSNGMPYYEGGPPHVGATSSFLLTLNHFYSENKQLISEGIGKLIQIYRKRKSLLPVESASWAFVLSLNTIEFLRLHPYQEMQSKITQIAKEILQNEEKIKTGEVRVKEILPAEYSFLSQIITGVIKHGYARTHLY